MSFVPGPGIVAPLNRFRPFPWAENDFRIGLERCHYHPDKREDHHHRPESEEKVGGGDAEPAAAFGLGSRPGRRCDNSGVRDFRAHLVTFVPVIWRRSPINGMLVLIDFA